MRKHSYEELEKELIELKKINSAHSKHQMLFDSMTTMVQTIEVIYDNNNKPIDFYIRDINLSFAKFLGKTKEQLINKKGSSINAKTENHWLISLASVDTTGDHISFKNHKAELDKYYYVTVWKVSKNRVGVSFSDITKNEKAEIENQKINETILDNIPADIAVFDKNHNYLYVNPNGIKNFETRKWIIGKSDFDYCTLKGLDESLAQGRRDIFNKTIQTKQQIEWVDKYHKNGKDIYIMRRFYPVFVDDVFYYVIGYGVDISERKKAQDQLKMVNSNLEEKSNKLQITNTTLNEYKENLESKVKIRTQELEESLGREKELGVLKTNFVSMASHEFRTPLTTIKGTSDVILRYFDKLSRDDIDGRLEKIKSEVDYMTVMLEDVLIIGKSEVQKLHYDSSIFDIVSLIKHLITEYQLSEYENRNIVYNISPPIIEVAADKKWIKHIVLNLISNAIKYSDNKKPIEITIEQKKSSVSFCFKDYGIGISKKDIKQLFEPFQRGENVGNISGTGLGLSVLKKAVELHKGEIEVKSDVNKGSSFKVTLPKKTS
jgi:PAS domain S-box-containing protein